MNHFLFQSHYSRGWHPTHPFSGRLFNTEDFDSFGQMELVVFKVCAEESRLCPRVREGYTDVADDGGFVLLHAQFRVALLEHNLWTTQRKNRKEAVVGFPDVLLFLGETLKCRIFFLFFTGLLLPTMTRFWSLRPPTVLLCKG